MACEKSYQIVADENEMKWFFDHVIEEPKNFESYLVCLSSRAKKLSAEERYELGTNGSEMLRTEIIRKRGGNWNFDIYKQGPYKYNCSYSAMLTKKGKPYPEKSLTCYAYFNPSSELACGRDTMEYFTTIQNELINSYEKKSEGGIEASIKKLTKVFDYHRSCHATNVSRRVWRDMDCDIEIPDYYGASSNEDILDGFYKSAHELLLSTFGKGNFVVIKTTGGFHILVRVASLKGDPRLVIEQLKTSSFSTPEIASGTAGDIIKEIKFLDKGSAFVPLPGTRQYKNVVRVLNKEDFDTTH